MKQKIEVNPFIGGVEALPDEEKRERSIKTGKMLEKLGLKAAIFDLALEGNERWFRNAPVVGKPSACYLIVLQDGSQYVSRGYGFGVLEKREPCLLNPLGTKPELEDTKTVSGLLGGERRIGISDPERMKYTALVQLKKEIPEIELVDISGEFAGLKAEKTKTDLEIMETVFSQHDRVMASVPSILIPGRTERDVVNELRYLAYRNGGCGFSMGRQVQVRMISERAGSPVEIIQTYPGRRMRKGDVVSISLQSVGMSGYFGSIGRSFVIGEPSEKSLEMWKNAVELQKEAASLLKPGITAGEVEERIRDRARERGCRLTEGFFIHGIGYAAVEAPYPGIPEKDIPIRENMLLSIGPAVLDENGFPYLCQDPYLVGENGAARKSRLHQQITAV